jgi:hypothetical protein
LVPARQPAALSSKLIMLIADAELRGRLGAAALHTVKSRFSTETMVRGAIGVYAETL